MKDIVAYANLFYSYSIFRLFSTVILPFRFLYDKSSMEFLYYKKRVAELRKDLLRVENTSGNGKINTFHSAFLSLFSLSLFLSEE